MRAQAVAAGFDLAGVAPAHSAGEPAGALTAERFAAWVEAGRAGEMEYLKRRDEAGELLRTSVQVAIPWARSVLVCAMSYNAAAPRSVEPAPATAGWIARYAWSGTPDGAPMDYHDDMLARLRVVEAALLGKTGCETRCYVDTGPILERDLAAKAGIGWIGKNTCVLNQQLGSWLLLGVIATSLPAFEGELALAPDRCGSCTRCIDACPTDALIAPRQMDASLCIAYLTIEKKGMIAEELRAKVGRQVFGCDICQDVCPWNRRSPVAVKQGLMTRTELVNPDLEQLASLDAAEFKLWFKGSPLERTKRHRLHRNVAIAMGNSGDRRFAARLERWSASEDAVLAEAARWALTRLAILTEESNLAEESKDRL
ncbi:epoxyqueuosine reductase [Granulicella rosea]|uniref:Epoxyqueuosine reductase n=2 Tax=Granulicella rosea TaxID=474952 RepID=A0A239IMC4_9BACT|nr:epoxyqueuosine reductase [Granulicella rosea]